MTPMYLDYFGMADAPFSIAPDPRYLFMSLRHREALAHLLYGVKSDDGFVVLTGEVGTGKTTVCRCLLEQLPGNCDVAMIFNPRLSVLELLATVCEEFRIDLPDPNPGIKAYIDAINAYLLASHARGRMAVLIIDEAQSLGADVLEQVRLLTNLETNQRKLLRILLLGQPQLRDLLARADMVQLAQRIVARYHLQPLSRAEMNAYVLHRLAVAGTRREVFSRAALERLYRLSGGIPRLANVLADRALLGAYVRGKDRVDGATIMAAGREVLGWSGISRRLSTVGALGLGGLWGMVAAAAYFHWGVLDQVEAVARAPITVAAVPPAGMPVPPAGPVPVHALAEAVAPPTAASPADPLPELLKVGSQGPAVARLRRELARIDGQGGVEHVSPVYDEALAARVRRFQVAEGLPADGMVGPQTRQRLIRAVAAAKPVEPGREG